MGPNEGTGFMGCEHKEPTDIIIDPVTGCRRTRGCVMCDGTHIVDGKDCPRCFDPARYDFPGDGIPHVCEDGEVVVAVAQVEDVPRYIIEIEVEPT